MSPKSLQQNQEMSAATRTKLLRSALELFASRGYSATPVDAIADTAGVSVGLLYYHFKNKPALLQSIFEQSLAYVHATFAAADHETDPRVRQQELMRSAGAIMHSHRYS